MAERKLNGAVEGAHLRMENVEKRFGPTVALDGVDFGVRSGEIHALVGENGAGKSTLMKVLSGVHRPDAGRMTLNDRPFEPTDPLDARETGIGMIYQELSLAPHLTVMENVLLGMEPGSAGLVDWKAMRSRTERALERLDHGEIDPETVVGTLSVSARQIVEIARTLTIGCDVLVLDEPTSSLSRPDIERLFEVIRELRSQGIAIIYISHFLEEVRQIADRVTVLRDGRSVGTREISSISADRIVRMMVGRDVEDLYPRSDHPRGEVLLEVEDLAGEDRPTAASFRLRRGEVLGVFGLVGAGRTELLRTIFGLDPVASGRIRVGTYEGAATPVERWRQGAGMLSENRKEEGLALDLSVADNVTLSRLDGFGPGGLVFPRRQEEAAGSWVERLDIRCEGPAQTTRQLSGGNQQKVALARLLQHEVDVLLLDEPTRGVDVAAKAKIYEVIDALATGDEDRAARAILMVSSHLPELLGVCDRIAVMYRGRLLPPRPVDELEEHALMAAATGQDPNL